MPTVFLLVALTLVTCLTALTGGALLLVGLLRKKPFQRRIGVRLFVGSLLALAGCFIWGSAKAIGKLQGTHPRQYWQALVAAAFDDTKIPPLDPATAKTILLGKLGPPAFLDGAEVQGLWVDGTFLSYGYFLYVADEKELLSVVASAPVDPSFLLTSDAACREASWDECRDELMSVKGPQRNIPGWAPETVTDKRCYRCLRCPWSHTIVIDGQTRQVYHVINEIRE